MKTIIAEKPSVAREIAGLVGASDKRDGYLTGNGYFVTVGIRSFNRIGNARRLRGFGI